jgi:hypothetical protein
MEKCKYCSTVIDPQVALAAVEVQEKINRACNSASLIRNLAGAMWVGFFLRFIPFIGWAGLILMLIGFFAVPVWLIIWLIRYGGIQTADIDYKRARRNALMALVLWLLIIIVPVVLIFVVAGFSLALSGR